MEKEKIIEIFENVGFVHKGDNITYVKDSDYICFTCRLYDDSVDISARIFNFIGETQNFNLDYLRDINYIKYALKDAKEGLPLSVGQNNLHDHINNAVDAMFAIY